MSIDFKKTECDLLVIETSLYSGNFERDMAAFITGHVGDTGLGQKSNQYDYSMFENIVCHLQSENGTMTPVSIYASKNYSNNGIGFIYKNNDYERKEEALKNFNEYIKNEVVQMTIRYNKVIDDYNQNGEEGTLYKQYKNIGMDINQIKKEIVTRKEKTLSRLKTIDQLHVGEAMTSVAIPFKKGSITENIVNLVKERAMAFIDIHHQNILKYRKLTKNNELIIDGFELIEYRKGQEIEKRINL